MKIIILWYVGVVVTRLITSHEVEGSIPSGDIFFLNLKFLKPGSGLRPDPGLKPG